MFASAVPSDAQRRRRRRINVVVSAAVFALVGGLLVRDHGPKALLGFAPTVLAYVAAAVVVNVRAQRRSRAGEERRRNAILTLAEVLIAVALASIVLTTVWVAVAGLDWRFGLFGLLALPMLGLGLLVRRFPQGFEGFVR